MKPEFTKVHQQTRQYHFIGGDIAIFEDVVSVSVSDSGTHRLNLKDGTKIIVAAESWDFISFEAKDWTF